jgi:hypothetical protein
MLFKINNLKKSLCDKYVKSWGILMDQHVLCMLFIPKIHVKKRTKGRVMTQHL